MFGPLGVSLASQVRASRTLSRALQPIADAYARAAGHRQVGLKYEDLIVEERLDVEKALSRLSPQEAYDRTWRLRRAVQQDILHKDLPKDQWIKAEEDTPYLTPIIKEVVKEDSERAYWDSVEATPLRK
ncbi:cytochrome bd ubiquinol oxidase subunit [Clavulina sp. PMI_390]|nr:cytochrome bd ubiquinol oxidase subunit [Clavulina sp. PMI_390]